MMNKYLMQSDLQDTFKSMYCDLLDVYHNSDHNIEKAIYLGKLETISDFLCKINDAPAADVVELKSGEWESTMVAPTGELVRWTHVHKECGYLYTDLRTRGHNFCPNCGADMRGEKNAVD